MAPLLLNFIKPDKTADFEMVMGKVKEALAKSEKPERKQQAAGWKVFKADRARSGRRDHLLRDCRSRRQGQRLQRAHDPDGGVWRRPTANTIYKTLADSVPPASSSST